MVKIERIDKAVSVTMKPVTEFLPAFLFLCICLFAPQLYGCRFGDGIVQLWKGLWNNMFLCCFTAYILLLPGCVVGHWKKWCGYAWEWSVVLICWFLTAVDFFLFKFFGTHVNAYILQLMNETNNTETAEFFNTYVLSAKFLEVIAFALCSAMLIAALIAAQKKLRVNSRIPVLLGLLYLCASVVYSASNVKAFSLNVIENTVYSLGRHVSKSSVFNIYNSFLQFFQEKSDFKRCFASQENIETWREYDGPDDIVVIIGESHNKYHSSLYGYPHNTNPRLGEMKGLFVFDDVISSVNATSQSFRNFMSLASLDGDSQWYEKPLFPAVFKSAGYNVNFYSNQFVYDPAQDTYDASCGFFNHPAIQNKLFSHKNSIKYQYDGELVDAYRKQRLGIENADGNLIIFHLSGQHVNAEERYPKEWEYFQADDYPERTSLDESQKQYVAHYDNATRYNDAVVNEIMKMYADKDAVVLYFSDHGDEVHDFRNHIGRSHDYKAGGAKSVHCQLDIPFLIYISDLCQTRHTELCRRISSSVHRPFMTDDLPHLLIDIAGIGCTDYQPSRSLISDEYNIKRKRIPRAINPSVRVDYDTL